MTTISFNFFPRDILPIPNLQLSNTTTTISSSEQQASSVLLVTKPIQNDDNANQGIRGSEFEYQTKQQKQNRLVPKTMRMLKIQHVNKPATGKPISKSTHRPFVSGI